MESNSLNRRIGLEEKIPELERTIGMVELLMIKEVCLSHFYFQFFLLTFFNFLFIYLFISFVVVVVFFFESNRILTKIK